MQAYEHELKIRLTFHPKDFKFVSNVKRDGFEKEMVCVIKEYLALPAIQEKTINEIDIPAGTLFKYGMRPHGIKLNELKDDDKYTLSDLYDVKVEEEEEIKK